MRKKIMLFVLLLVIAIVPGKVSAAKYNKIDIVTVILPYDGSKLRINDDYNFLLEGSELDLDFENIAVYLDDEELDHDAIAELGNTYKYEFAITTYDENDSIDNYIDESSKVTFKSALGDVQAPIEFKDGIAYMSYEYTVKSEADTPAKHSVKILVADEDYASFLANDNVPYKLNKLSFAIDVLSERGKEKAKTIWNKQKEKICKEF